MPVSYTHLLIGKGKGAAIGAAVGAAVGTGAGVATVSYTHLGITFVYVTHDQEEALTLSDTIVVMSEGRTIIFVTHNPEIAQYSSRNIVLRDGQIKDDTINTQIPVSYTHL